MEQSCIPTETSWASLLNKRSSGSIEDYSVQETDTLFKAKNDVDQLLIIPLDKGESRVKGLFQAHE